MKKLPMMLQLTVILFFVMVVPTSILTWYSGSQIYQYSETAIAETSLAQIKASSKLVENTLDNLAQNTIRLASSKVFDGIRPFPAHADLSLNYANLNNAMKVQQELSNLIHRVEGIHSSFFYLLESDYVISTDKGITKLNRYESMEWMLEALASRKGISGVWYPRKLDSGVDVISYVLPLNQLSTATRGVIFVNLEENQLEQIFQFAELEEQRYFIIDSDGKIVSHNDKSLLTHTISDESYVRNILMQESNVGFAYHEWDGDRLLYSWSKFMQPDWTSINIYSVNDLMQKSNALQRQIILLTSIIIFAGMILTIFLATWLSKPIRDLVRMLRQSNQKMNRLKGRNEYAFIEESFKRMQEEEEILHRLLNSHKKDASKFAIHNLLRGEVSAQMTELYEIMLQLTRSTSDSPNYGELIINYLEQHYREDINFEDMAKHIGISYSYIRRIVNELTGQSLNDYLNQLRIEKAKQLLVEKDMTIAQISLEVGYYNVQSFNRFFRKFEGLPPSSYRSKLSKNKY